MSIYDDIKLSLNQAIAYEKKTIKARKNYF